MTTMIVTENGISADRRHASKLDRTYWQGKKLIVNESNTVAIAVVGGSLLEPELHALAENVHEYLLSGKEVSSLTLKDISKEHANDINTVGLSFILNGNKHNVAVTTKSVRLAIGDVILTSGTGSYIAEYYTRKNKRSGFFDPESVHAIVAKHDVQSSKECDYVFIDELDNIVVEGK